MRRENIVHDDHTIGAKTGGVVDEGLSASRGLENGARREKEMGHNDDEAITN